MQANPASQLAMQGQQAMQMGMYEQAAQYFAQAIYYAPNVDGLHYHYASACLWRGVPSEALASLDRCMALRGQWFNHAMQLSTQIRGQMGMQMAPMGMQQPMGMPMGMQQPMGAMGMPMQQMPMQQMPMQQMPMQQMPMQQQMPQPLAAAPAAPAKEEKKKKKGVGWGVAALGIVGAVALGGAIGTGALDGVGDKIF